MRRTDENAAEDNPQRNRRPAEFRGKDRPDDRTRARNRREVMSEQDRRMRRHVVATVLLGNCRGLFRRIDSQLVGEPFRIDEISDQKAGGHDQQQNCTIHFCLFLN